MCRCRLQVMSDRICEYSILRAAQPVYRTYYGDHSFRTTGLVDARGHPRSVDAVCSMFDCCCICIRKFDAFIAHVASLIDALSNCRIGVASSCTVYSTGYELPQGSPSTPLRLWKPMSEPCSCKQQKADLPHPTRMLRAETRVAQPDLPKRRPPNQPGLHPGIWQPPAVWEPLHRRDLL
jgi:hypothetical protein